MSESFIRIIAFHDILVIEFKSVSGFQRVLCCGQGFDLFVNDVLVHFSFFSEGFGHVDFIQVNRHGSFRINCSMSGQEIFCFPDGGPQGCEIAGGTISEFMLQIFGDL